MKEFKTIWSDGYISIIINKDNKWFLIGNIKKFDSLEALEKHYKGEIKSIKQY